MEFKVGDRVEVLTPADGAQPPPKPGPGTITAVSQFEGEYRVKLDSDQTSPDYYYSKDQLRPVPSTLTPSITVGTQVRLTGVVRQVQPNRAIGVDVYVGCQNGLHWFRPEEVEVIRQPFKRGEVVYFEDHDIACVVLEDEQNGRMLLIEAGEGKYATYVDADQYERRP